MARQPKEQRDLTPGSAIKLHSLRSFTEAVARSQFTDGGGTSGTFALTNKIPKGALVHDIVVRVPTGFAGDTTATLTVGDGSDVDRYNTGTPSVFAAAANGVAMGIPSGAKYHTAEATVTLTITSTADFTSVSAGRLIITMTYFHAGHN